MGRMMLLAVLAVACIQVSVCFLAPSTSLVGRAAQRQVLCSMSGRRGLGGGLRMSAASGADEHGSKVGRLARWRSAVLRAVVTAVALAGPVLTTPNRALAEGRDPTSAEPRMHSQQVAAKSEGEGVEFALRGGSGRKLVMVAKAAEVEATKAPAVMLSFKDPATKKTLAAVVTVGYAAIWLFFFLTHDSGEVSE